MGHYRFSKDYSLPQLFAQLVEQQADGCLHLSGGVVSWFVYLKQGKLLYASNSIDPFGRFDRYLRRLSVQIPSLVSAIRIQVRLLFEAPKLLSNEDSSLCRDYQAINWLVEQRHLNLAQAAILIEELAKEVMESLLSVPEGDYELLTIEHLPVFCQLDLPSLLEFCQSRLRQRQAAGLTVPSSRPTSFNPTSPYSLSTLAQQSATAIRPVHQPVAEKETTGLHTLPRSKSSYTIACIDDSPAVLKSINSFLDDENFSVIMINDPVKALMQIIRSKPDLILLDVTMPNLDGYELCSLLRKHPSFRQTPVIMVTSNTGFLDRAKAKLVGASGYLTKPFTQPDLVKMVFKHLT
ncbi:response regulator [Leptolyngbya sp. 7M]|uniref:response regulator n=1 Tax=Leptolyngbya sp. 7M TaxID=2812896 RepID=UPI001B8D2320|nr:response regulator [Leptolyngbya sp. 7M]QYO61988.1 response regulator [Leptolyngbya sp. 7M]